MVDDADDYTRARVGRDLVPLVRAAAAEVPNAPAPAVPLAAIVSREGNLVEVVGLAMTSAYRVEVNRRFGELLGDLDTWQPTGILNMTPPTGIEVSEP